MASNTRAGISNFKVYKMLKDSFYLQNFYDCEIYRPFANLTMLIYVLVEIIIMENFLIISNEIRYTAHVLKYFLFLNFRSEISLCSSSLLQSVFCAMASVVLLFYIEKNNLFGMCLLKYSHYHIGTCLERSIWTKIPQVKII